MLITIAAACVLLTVRGWAPPPARSPPLRRVLCASRPSAEARRLAKSAARDEEWEHGLASLIEFAKAAGHCDPPYKHMDARGFKLWEWLQNQRVARVKGTLPDARAKRLAELNAHWFESPEMAAAGDREWERHFNLLREFAEEAGHANPTKYETVWTVRVGLWLHRQRLARRKGELPAHKVAQLEELGVKWETIDWDTGIGLLEDFAAREGHADVPKKHFEGDLPLGRWLRRQRRAHQAGDLDEARAVELVSRGVAMSPRLGRDQ